MSHNGGHQQSKAQATTARLEITAGSTTMRTIFDQLRMHATFTPMKPAIVLPDRTVTYEMLVNGISSVQATLATLPLNRDHPIGILIDTPTRHLIVMLALMRSGFASASIRTDQIDDAMKFGINVILTNAAIPLLPGIKPFFVDDKWFSNPPKIPFAEALLPNQIVKVVFTSGSTGIPKLIGWSSSTLHQWIKDCCDIGIASHPRVLTTFGLSSAGIPSILRVLSSGNTIVFSSLEQSLQTISTLGVTEVRSTTFQIRTMLEIQRTNGFNLRISQFTPGGGHLSVEMMEDIERSFKSNILNTYAATEAGYMGLASGEVLRMRRHKGNCFLPLSTIEIVGDTGSQIPNGVEGRIRVRSQGMGWPFAGNLMETDAVKGDGWFYPGDVGLIDSDGLLIVTGRADEVINDGGVKFSPELMEDHLARHPGIADVAIVRMSVGQGPAEAWIALVTRGPITLDLIHDWIAQNLAGELSSVRFSRLFVVDLIPKTETGKVARPALRDLLRARQ